MEEDLIHFEMLNSAKNKMVEFGKTTTDEEICAILLGQKTGQFWVCTQFKPLENIAHDPVYYKFNPQEFMDIVGDTRFIDPKNGRLDLLGVYHTHPNNEAYPSTIDINEAGYRGIYIIHSPKYNQTNIYFCSKPGDIWSSLNVKL